MIAINGANQLKVAVTGSRHPHHEHFTSMERKEGGAEVEGSGY
jgi:hypothetical protein